LSFFCPQHPGGEEILLEYAGRDATLAFRGIGHGVALLQALERFFLGILPESERIYSSLGGKLAGNKLLS
jgi:cytochrome b involved in lipid metabolism